MNYRERLWNHFYAEHFLECLKTPSPFLNRFLGESLSEKSWKRLKQFFLLAPLVSVEEFARSADDPANQ